METVTRTGLPTNGFAGKELEHARDLVAKHKAVTTEIGKVIVGQSEVIEELAHRATCARTLPAYRRSRSCKNVADLDACRSAASGFQSHSVHSRSDAVRYYRYGNFRAEYFHRRKRISFYQRTGLCQYYFGR